MKKRLVVMGAATAAAIWVSACGDNNNETPSTDLSVNAPKPTAAEAGPDSGSAFDASAEPELEVPPDEADAAPTCGGGTPGDAGASPQMWTSAEPAGSNRTVVGTVTAGGCLITTEWVLDPEDGNPTKWTSYVRKSDAPGSMCNEAKGVVVLAARSYEQPTLQIAVSNTVPRLLVVGWDEHPSYGAASITSPYFAQFDVTTGSVLHRGIFATHAADAGALSPTPIVSSLIIDGCDVVVAGLNNFPAAGPRGHFRARYSGFVSGVPQAPSEASAVSFSE